jgi:diaminopimelate epimerase
MTGTLHVHKMNGLGNAILVADLRGSARPLDAAAIKALAQRPPWQFEQLMALYPPRTPGTDAYVVIYNADGSEAEACGNGMRCIAWLVATQAQRRALAFETVAGVLAVTVDGIDAIAVDMGRPKFAWHEIPLAEPFHDTRSIELQLGPIDAPLLHSPSVVNIGNPHAVFWVDDVERYDLGRFGPLLENHPIFPERANISLAQVAARDAIVLRTWERGAGLTKACGSAACAAVVCAARKKATARSVTVTLPGGRLLVEWRADDHVLMTGPVVLEHEGDVELCAAA